ncbi:MAG: hypothetical protein A2Z01_10105 [Betaproteobacteria bacterium RBG_16_58_11]|nr:MAG: hypothetical protein A2Z01_10105 [Betaproteobacteria bacterium RBG_16_58_11]
MTPRFFRHSQYTISVGFVLVLILMAAIAVIGLTRMAAINERMNVIVSQHNVKTDLVAAMRNAARERSISLHRMALMTDPFDREDEHQYFRRMAEEFLKARDALKAMSLSTLEQQTLADSQALTRQSTLIQEAVYGLVQEQRLDEANTLLLREAVPAQNRVLAVLSKLLDYQRQATSEAVGFARREYDKAFYSMIGLGLLLVGLGAVIAFMVVRRTSHAEKALFHEKERAEVTLHSIADAVITTDGDGVVDYMNPIAEQLTGWQSAEARGHPIDQIFRVVNELNREAIKSPVSECKIEGRVVSVDPHGVLVARDGTEYAIEDSAAPIHDSHGAVIGYVVVFHDVSHARRLARQLSWQASHDVLTGLGNRLEFEAVMAQMWESAKFHNKQHALVYMDLDQFKIVNDTCGHAAGDELLRQLALIISAKVREGDSLFRLGGDEFAILLNGCPISRAEGIANEIRLVVEEFRFMWEEKPFSIGASIGLVPITVDSVSVASLLAAADAACYTAKEKGRNRVQVYEPSDTELVMREGEMAWLPRINRAIDEDRLQLYYQKIANVRDGDVMGGTQYELLLRMTDEHGAIVPPQAFIPAAERYNLMPNVDRWVIRHALDWITRHAAQVRDVSTIYINLSGQSLNDDKFLDFVTGQIQRLDGLGIKIGFEITETAAIANLSRAMRLMGALKEMGCVFALDDFGSGMSSFAYLKNLPVDKIKIDGVFVRDMLSDRVDYAMVEAINRIGHLMGIQTVAEFVENDAILQKLKELGVDYAQGYGIHRPEPLALLFAEPRLIHTTAIAR